MSDNSAMTAGGDMRPAPGLLSVAVVMGSLAFLFVALTPQVLNDGDTLWQIRTGEWIMRHLAIPFTDPFAYTTAGLHWFQHEWLAEVLMGAAFRIAGFPGAMLLAASAVGLATGLLCFHLTRYMAVRYAITGTLLALFNTFPSLLVRPHLLVWPLIVGWCGGLITARAYRTAPSLALLPLMLVWVNMHGSFMLGLLLPGFFLIEALFDPGADRVAVLRGWGVFIAASWLTAALNPEFLQGVLFPLHLIRMKELFWISEWKPANFSHLSPLELIIMAGLALGLSGRLRLPPVRIAILLCLIHAALSHIRNEQLLSLVGVLVLAEPVARHLPRDPRVWPARAGAWCSGVGVAVCAAAVAMRLVLPLDAHRTGAAFAAVLEKVPASLRATNVLNDYDLGAVLIFSGVRPFIDSRADLYGDALLTRYRRIATDPEALRKALVQDHIGWAIAPIDSKLGQLMDAQPGWHAVAEGDGDRVYAPQT